LTAHKKNKKPLIKVIEWRNNRPARNSKSLEKYANQHKSRKKIQIAQQPNAAKATDMYAGARWLETEVDKSTRPTASTVTHSNLS